MAPKRNVIIALQVLLQSRELLATATRRFCGSVPLRIRLQWIAARLVGVEALMLEMAEMRVKVTTSGGERA